MNKDKRIVAIYARESTMRQVEKGYNMEAQVEACVDYLEAKNKGAKYEIYEEKGKSAKTIKRKELKKIIEGIKCNKIKTIMIYRLDRLTRRIRGFAEIIDLCDHYDVDIISVSENFDSKTLTGKMICQFIVMCAQWEQDSISERTITALDFMKNKGSYSLGNKPPFGYQREIIYREMTCDKIIRLVPVDEEFEICKKIFQMSKDGYNNSQIAVAVNEESYMIAHGLKLDDRRIENILSNKIYCGYMVIKGKEYKLDMEILLSSEEWEQIQINRSIHFKNGKNDYIFKGKVYDENNVLCTVDVTNKRNRKGEFVRKYFYYESPTTKLRYNQDKIMEQIEPKLRENWDIKQEEKMKMKLTNKVRKCETLRDKMFEMYVDGCINEESYFDELEKINNELVRTKEILSINKKDYDDLTEKEKQSYIANGVDKIILNMEKKKVRVVFS